MQLIKRQTIFFYVAIVSLVLTLMFLWDAIFSSHLSYFFPFVSYGGTFRWSSIQLGGVKISLYWSAHIVGVILMCLLCYKRRHLCDLSRIKAVVTALLLAVFGFVGAKLLFLIENLNYILENHVSVGLGGLSFFGTVFFMPIAIALMARLMRIKFSAYLDYCTPSGILMLACIRWGCFMRGCCHGLTIWLGTNPITFPTQLMECTLDLFLLNFILCAERSDQFSGDRYVIFMGGYGILRFVIEFLRSTPKNVLFLSNGQWFSLVCIFIMLSRICLKNKTNAKQAARRS